MNLYEAVRLVHIASAVALLSGSVVASPAIRAAVRRARTTQEIRAYLSIGRPLLAFEPAAAVVVLATGVYLTSAAQFWAVSWVQVAAVFWLVNALVAGTIVKPVTNRLADAAAAAADDPVGPHLDALRRSATWTLGGDVLMANDAAMLYLMVMKPGLTGSLVAVGVINVAVAAARAARGGFRADARADRSP